ncbi:hypothetical protein ACOAKG_43740 [Streptomyces sp. JL3001]|uniref:hypothetical protein n=1 Tax=Streptomyces sp. JL3001 TaxID=3400923 RepID=UPI003B27C964
MSGWAGRGEAAHRVGVAVQVLDPGQGVRHQCRVEVVADRGTLLLGEVGAQRHFGTDVVVRVLCQHGDAVRAQGRVGGQCPAYVRVGVPDQLRLQFGCEAALFERLLWLGQGGEDLAGHGCAGVVGEERGRSHRVVTVGQQPLPQWRSEVFPPGTGGRPHPGIGVAREAGEVPRGEAGEVGGLRAGGAGEEVVVQVLGERGARAQARSAPEDASFAGRLGADQVCPLIGCELGPEGVGES